MEKENVRYAVVHRSYEYDDEYYSESEGYGFGLPLKTYATREEALVKRNEMLLEELRWFDYREYYVLQYSDVPEEFLSYCEMLFAKYGQDNNSEYYLELPKECTDEELLTAYDLSPLELYTIIEVEL